MVRSDKERMGECVPLTNFERMTTPDWLGQALCLDDLPWDRALETTMPAFLDLYTLHDSRWRGLVLHPGRVGVLCLLWDAYWTRGRVPDFGGLGPLLFVRLVLHKVDVNFATRILMSVRSGPADEGWHRTSFESDGPLAELVHAPGVQMLCLGLERQVIPIPMGAAISPDKEGAAG